MTIYKELLGGEFHKLHPKLQERYSFTLEQPFHGVGRMSKIERGKSWVTPFLLMATRWKFLFPEEGKDIPFSIRNSSKRLPSGEEEIYWERSFHFEKVTRHFNAIMSIDPKRRVVKDYLGEPNLFYSDLKLKVTSGGSLQIDSGSQRILIGKSEVPIPRFLEGVVTVEEGYDEKKEAYTIKVDIRNRIIGRLMAYEGEFRPQ